MKKLTTYSFTRPFSGHNIPLAVQSVYMRNYAQSNAFLFTIPTVEITKNNSYIKLMKLFKDSKKITDIAFTSLFMLPITDNVLFLQLIKQVKNKNLKFHFILESLVLSKSELIDYQKEVSSIKMFIPDFQSSIDKLKNIIN